MGIVFRLARPADAGELVGLVEELGHPTPLVAVQTRLARLLECRDQAVFVADAEGELLGWVHVQEFLSLASDPAGLVTGLVVDPAARRRGLGRGLMAAAEGWARARGLGSLRLRARAQRTAAHEFYRRLGFELAKRQLQFTKEL
jgi:GNAT superfamily N-acetyltransferase